MAGGDHAEGSVPIPLAAPTAYVPEWGITWESPLSHHTVANDWDHHAFPLTTIEALELLSNTHLSNNLLYAAVQVGSYMVATTSHLR